MLKRIMRSIRVRLAFLGILAASTVVPVLTRNPAALSGQSIEANPASIQVINQAVADYVHGSPVDFSTPSGRSAVASSLSTFQTASGGQVGLHPSVSGQVLVLVLTDGSASSVFPNGR